MKPLDDRTSAAMARVKQEKTGPEQTVAAALRRLNVAYRRNVKGLPGRPDFANRKRNWAVLVHGCFWHSHGCKRGARPTHNSQAWAEKLDRNVARDAVVEDRLHRMGFKVLVIWECELADEHALAGRLMSFLKNEQV